MGDWFDNETQCVWDGAELGSTFEDSNIAGDPWSTARWVSDEDGNSTSVFTVAGSSPDSNLTTTAIAGRTLVLRDLEGAVVGCGEVSLSHRARAHTHTLSRSL